MSNYEDVANIMLGKKSDVICDNYYNAYSTGLEAGAHYENPYPEHLYK